MNMSLKIMAEMRPNKPIDEKLKKNVRKALEKLYNSTELQDIVIENTWDKVPKLEGFLRASVIKYKQLYRHSSSIDGIHAMVRFRALNVRKDMKNVSVGNFSQKDLTGETFNYAYIQEVHEYEHYTTAGTGSRYLERGMEESLPRIRKITAETINKAVKEK